MTKKLKDFSIQLEEMLRSNKFILNNRDDLLLNMFGGSPLENEIKKRFFEYDFSDYFFIGKILFLKKFENNFIKKNNSFITLLKSQDYLIIKDNFDLDNLKKRLPLPKSTPESNVANAFEDKWITVLNEIQNLEVIIKLKSESKFFDFSSTQGDSFKLSKIIKEEFKNSCHILFKSKDDNYKNNKLDNALFLSELSKFIKKRTILDNIIGISKDKVSDFKIISNNINLKKDWDKLSWTQIKNLKEEK